MKNIGDIVTIKVPVENLEWGFKAPPDGTKCVITGFGTITCGRIGNFGRLPGIYENTSSLYVKYIIDGVETTGGFGSHMFEENIPFNNNPKKISELPETKFWEGDIVKFKSAKRGYNFADWGKALRIDDIKWYWEKKDNKYCYSIVSNTIPNSGSSFAEEDDLELLYRGKVWNYYHNEPLTFKDIKEEAEFYSAIGKTKEVRNPLTAFYKWNLDEALCAIILGIGDGFHMSNSLFWKSDPSPVVIKFSDIEVGKRVSRSTLDGFRDYLDGKEEIRDHKFNINILDKFEKNRI